MDDPETKPGGARSAKKEVSGRGLGRFAPPGFFLKFVFGATIVAAAAAFYYWSLPEKQIETGQGLSSFSPETEAVNEGEKFRIATWNIQNLSAETSAGGPHRTSEDFALLSDYSRTLDPGVVALQEVEGPEAASKVFDPASFNFYFSAASKGFPAHRVGFAVKKGVAVIQHADLEALNLDGHMPGGVDISATVGDKSLRLLGIHLKAGCRTKPIQSDAEGCERLRGQIKVVRRWVLDREKNREPFVVLGDWNRRFSGADNGAWEALVGPNGNNLKLHRAGSERGSNCGGDRRSFFIDHIVYSSPLGSLVDQESFREWGFKAGARNRHNLSDHCAVSIDLALGGRP